MVDGIDIRQMEATSFRSKIGALLQDSSLLTGTIRENIDLGRGQDETEMMRVSQLSGAHDFIATLPKRLRTASCRPRRRAVGWAAAIDSAGACALWQPPIMVLDEPTSAIDTDTEASLVAKLKEEFAGRTLILVTHRPSLLALVDRVILMSRGRMVVEGSPDQISQKIALLKAG